MSCRSHGTVRQPVGVYMALNFGGKGAFHNYTGKGMIPKQSRVGMFVLGREISENEGKTGRHFPVLDPEPDSRPPCAPAWPFIIREESSRN